MRVLIALLVMCLRLTAPAALAVLAPDKHAALVMASTTRIAEIGRVFVGYGY